MRRGAWAGWMAGLIVLAGCSAEPIGRKAFTEAGVLDAAVLDTLTVPRGFAVEVSVDGVIADKRDDGRLLLLRDATGGVRVVLPDSLALPVGARLLVQGLLRRPRGTALLEAETWLYDSTAVPVRSP
ncbi:MAG: hypothetical protein HKN04_04120 [Rhodothermaceae bacterium]|nr:hypothetical protein [Rhodothermaceae bacterium]